MWKRYFNTKTTFKLSVYNWAHFYFLVDKPGWKTAIFSRQRREAKTMVRLYKKALARSRNRRSSINQCYAKKAIVNIELKSPYMTCATAGSKAWAHSEHLGTEVSHACGIFGDWKRNEVTHKSFVSFSIHFAK